MDNEKAEENLMLDNFGRTMVTGLLEKVEPDLYGSVVFNFRDGVFCNWEIKKRGQEQKHN